jgi:hypothetical protein
VALNTWRPRSELGLWHRLAREHIERHDLRIVPTPVGHAERDQDHGGKQREQPRDVSPPDP